MLNLLVILVLSVCGMAQAEDQGLPPYDPVTNANVSSPAQGTPSQQGEAPPVDFQADSLTHDEAAQTITAIGNVVMIQAGRTLKADSVTYNLTTDTAYATGNVYYEDEAGDKHHAERVEFNNAMRDGFVQGLRTFLADGARFTAKKGEQKGGVVTTMHDAAYTPCKVCETDPNSVPTWQIRASEVTHDRAEKRVSYKNPRFEVEGVPVLWMPYFSHADGTVKRKTGFLAPSAGYNNDLGAFVETIYYWALAPEKDATFGIVAMTEEAPLAMGQWRQRWDNAELEANTSVTYSTRTDTENGVTTTLDEEVRGHIDADGLWNINDKWRSGLQINMASDDQYMRQYNFDSEDVLENELYFERFSGRDYSVGRILAFQDTRVEEDRGDQPDVLPEIQTHFLGEPGNVPLIGGRWSLGGSVLGLRREAGGQDMSRLGADLGWNRRAVSDIGLVTTLDALARGELYRTHDREGAIASTTIESDSTEMRGFASFNAQASYPLSKNLGQAQAVIEPIAAITLAPNIDEDQNIPNEDSQDVQIDASNLFEANRFPGLDRVEDDSHMTYGVRTGLYGFDGSHGDVFLGQSYRFDDDRNPFAQGSGLDEQESDFVGQVSADYRDYYLLNYRFQLDNDDLSPERHEIDAGVNLRKFSLSSRYLYAKALEGTDIVETREQIDNGVSYYLDEEWRVSASARHDLGEDPGLRAAALGVDYFGQCLSWSLIGQRTLTEDISGDSDTTVVFRIGLKNLGEFQESGLRDDRRP